MVIAVSDRALKMMIGLLGILFAVYFAAKKWILRHLHATQPNWVKGSVFGFGAGMTSTLAHAAGPVMQMYLFLDAQPDQAASLRPAWTDPAGQSQAWGRTTSGHPAGGVAFGWWLTHKTEQKHYTVLIYTVLLVTSVALILKAL
jgi:uncharacterized membrane protein YfcA